MIQIPTIEMSDNRRIALLVILILLFVGLMIFEVIRTENYKKEVYDLCLKNDNRICRCQEDLSFSNGLLQIT